jgi:hypothetical protein
MSTRLTATTRIMAFSDPNNPQKHLNPAIKAAITGGVGAGVTGLFPALKSGFTPGILKSAAGFGAAGAAIAGGGAYLGSKILGAPKPGEVAPTAKRAALGGALAGGALGAGAAILAKRNPLIAGQVGKLAENGWKPAAFIQKTSMPIAALVGGGVGAAYGAHSGAEDGLMADGAGATENNNQPPVKKGFFSARLGLIRFDRFKTSEDGVPLNGRVAHDRFIKKIHNDDLDRRDNNMRNAGLAGAAVGALTKGSGGIKGAAIRAAIGGSAGGAAVLGVRTITNRRRDIYGDRTRAAKNAENIPTVAGAAGAGYLAYRGLKKHAPKAVSAAGKVAGVAKKVGGVFLSARSKQILFGEGSSRFRDAAIGTGALAAGGGVVYAAHRAGQAIQSHDSLVKKAARFVDKAGGAVDEVSGTARSIGRTAAGIGRTANQATRTLGEHERLAKAAADSVQRVNQGVQGIAGIASKFKTGLKNAMKFKFCAIDHTEKRIFLFGESDQPRWKNSGKYAQPLEGWARNQRFVTSQRDSAGNILEAPVLPKQAIHSALRKGHQYRVAAQRTGGFARDISDSVAGRPRQGNKKKEWEKSWFKNAATAAVLGAGALGVAAVRRRARVNPTAPLSRKILKTEARVRKGVSDVNRWVDKTVESTARKFKLSMQGNIHHFDAMDGFGDPYRGWDLRDPRGKSARVFAPGHQKRVRRQAEWHETKDGQKKILVGAGVAGTLLAGGVAGVAAHKIGYGQGQKQAIRSIVRKRVERKAAVVARTAPAKITSFLHHLPKRA